MRITICLLLALVFVNSIHAQIEPPTNTVRLVFIHHSTGEDWLSGGGLRQTLNDNNYYVTDTNYSWGPDSIGDNTDIGHWHNWFLGASRDTYMASLYANDHITGGVGPNSIADPGGSNTVVMFKSCFPNSNVEDGNTDDPPLPAGEANPIYGNAVGGTYTVSNIKGLYRDLLDYFATQQDKLFVFITTPPLLQESTSAQAAARHRAICNWMVDGWLDDYPYNNVFAFDYYNVLTSNNGNANTNDLDSEIGNHHRYRSGAIEHVIGLDNNYSAYGQWGDSHPSNAGHQKATGEFVPLLNLAYDQWNANNTYYVAVDGDDGDPGTYAEPWATPGHGSKQLQAGDTLIIRDGTYVLSQFYDDMITPLNSGTADAWITIKGEDGSTPVIAGRDNLFSAIDLDGVSYVRIENLEVTSDGGAWFRDGVNGDNLSHIELKQLNIHHIDEFGINLGDIDNLLVDECTITYCGFGSIGGPAGDSGGWQNILISDCDLSYNGHYYQGGDGSDRPYDRPDGFGIEESTGPIEIVDCTAEHNRGDGLDSKAANTYMHNCIVSNNSCDGIKLWGDNSRVHNCLIYGTGDGVPGTSPWAALVIGTETANADFEIINVTIHDTTETQNYPMYVQYDSTAPITLVMKNSIVAGGYGAVFIGDSVTFTAEYNIFHRPGDDPQVEANGREYTAQQIETGELGIGNLSQNPLFVAPAWGGEGDYHLQDGSPAVDAGTSGAGIPDADLEYKQRPEGSAYDMGAYECAVSGEPINDAPSSITDLAASASATGNSIDLVWTAPGDDGDTGTASLYIIRYNTDPITESNWDESTNVDGEPAPQPAGSAESMTVNMPYPGVTYYFAIKTQDDEENISDISNSPSAMAEAIRLYAGWNLVSMVCNTIIPIDEFMTSVPQCESIWAYYASIPGWLRHLAGGPAFLNNLTHIGPGYGFWIRVTTDCVWNCGAVGALSPSSLMVQRPPFLLYGRAGQSGTISVRHEGKEAASYVMGSEPRYGDYYVLEIPVDDTFHEGDSAQVYINGAPADGHPIELGGMGVVRRYDIPCVQSPRVTLLLQNYPNPFNPDTWIPYQLSKASNVTIKIYDITGKMVRSLDLGYKPAGTYRTQSTAAYWNGQNKAGEPVASGVYLAVLKSGKDQQIRRMFLVK